MPFDALPRADSPLGRLATSIADTATRAAGTSRRRAQPVDSAADKRLRRQTIRNAIDAYVAKSFTVFVPGSHAGGLSNMELLGFLKDGGRDFTAVTSQMRASIKARLQQEFLDADAVPLRLDFDAIRNEVVAEMITGRILGTIRDVRVKALLASTIARKRKLGYSNPARPGFATGELAESAADARAR